MKDISLCCKQDTYVQYVHFTTKNDNGIPKNPNKDWLGPSTYFCGNSCTSDVSLDVETFHTSSYNTGFLKGLNIYLKPVIIMSGANV